MSIAKHRIICDGHTLPKRLLTFFLCESLKCDFQKFLRRRSRFGFSKATDDCPVWHVKLLWQADWQNALVQRHKLVKFQNAQIVVILSVVWMLKNLLDVESDRVVFVSAVDFQLHKLHRTVATGVKAVSCC